MNTPEQDETIIQAGIDVLLNLKAVKGQGYADAVSAAAIAGNLLAYPGLTPGGAADLLYPIAQIQTVLAKLANDSQDGDDIAFHIQFSKDVRAYAGAISSAIQHHKEKR